MQTFKVELPERWEKLAKSSSLVVVTALICLSLAFGPLSLFMLGKEGANFTDPRVILSFAATVLLPLVYIRLAALVLYQLRSDGSHSEPGAPNRVGSLLLWVLTTGAAVAIYYWLRA